jgi:hypothetical protein
MGAAVNGTILDLRSGERGAARRAWGIPPIGD